MRDEPDPAMLFPEVAARGSLAAALDAVAHEQGVMLRFRSDETDPLRSAAIVSRARGRHPLGVSGWRFEPKWSISGSGGRPEPDDVWLLHGVTEDLAPIAVVALAWRDGVPLDEIEQISPWVRLTGHHEVLDGDPIRLHDSQWSYLRRTAHNEGWPEHQALVEAAFTRPELHRLHPYTSHWSLRFSTMALPDRPAVSDKEISINTICLSATSDGKYRLHASLLGEQLAEFDTAEELVSAAARYAAID